jgi:MerR family mercuric resistance operon transcriptional regulator
MGKMTIGRVAAQAGVNTETLRYYERRGLVVGPPRSESNYRLYPPETVARVRFIKRAQELGFGLDEIGSLLTLRETPQANHDKARTETLIKISKVDAKIASLQSMRDALASLMETYDQGPSNAPCPVIHSLNNGNGTSH